MGARTAIGRKLTNALANAGRTESTIPLEEEETLGAEVVQEEEAKAEEEKPRTGLTKFTDRSRLEDKAVGYAVVWNRGESWAGIKTSHPPGCSGSSTYPSSSRSPSAPPPTGSCSRPSTPDTP